MCHNDEECTQEMTNHYIVTEKKIMFEGESIVSYGIMLCRDDDVIESVDDVFIEHSKAQEFVDLLNAEKADPLHLMQLIEEALMQG